MLKVTKGDYEWGQGGREGWSYLLNLHVATLGIFSFIWDVI